MSKSKSDLSKGSTQMKRKDSKGEMNLEESQLIKVKVKDKDPKLISGVVKSRPCESNETLNL